MPTSCRWRPSRLPAVVPPLWQLVGPRCVPPPSPPRPPPHLPAAPAGEDDHFLPRVSTLLMSALLKVTATLKTMCRWVRGGGQISSSVADVFTLFSFFSSFCCRSADFMPYVFKVFPVSIVAGCYRSQTSSITGHFVRVSVENMSSSEINNSFSLSDPSNVSTIWQKMFVFCLGSIKYVISFITQYV